MEEAASGLDEAIRKQNETKPKPEETEAKLFSKTKVKVKQPNGIQEEENTDKKIIVKLTDQMNEEDIFNDNVSLPFNVLAALSLVS